MVRRRYLMLLWTPGDDVAERAALRHLESLEAEGLWRRAFAEPGWSLILEADTALRVRPLGLRRGAILGDLFHVDGSEAPRGQRVALTASPNGSRQVFEELSRRFWGRYVAFHQSTVTESAAMFRDPSGAMECLTWRRDRVRLVSSHLPTHHADLMPGGLGVDWAGVACRLSNPAATASGVALTGFEALDAGEMMDLKTTERTLVWSPAAFVRRAREPREVSATRLRERVDQVVGAHASQAGVILAELSGGLDSAIVAGALQATSAGKVGQWINFHTADPEGDERTFARAAAARLGISVVEAAKGELELTEAHLAVVGDGLRPSTLPIDYGYDEDNVARCFDVGADTMMTGQGGDAVFFQTQTPLIAADAVRAGLSGFALWRVFRDVAAHRRTSVWSAARMGLLASFGHAPLPRPTPPYLTKACVGTLSRRPAHPWLTNLDGAAPAKRLQIRSLAAAQHFHGHSRRGEAVDLIHPLLSQPLVELVLGVPSFDLALGSNDRALAREAFADRLPMEVLRRRSKGDLQAYYGRMLSRSLGILRPFLLEGLLAREGLIDRVFLEEALTPESLLWRDLVGHVAGLIAVEAWARRWHRGSRG